MTFAVVGCSECSFLWISEDLGDQTETECPRCVTAHPTQLLDPLVETEEFESAAEGRGAILAHRRSEGDAYDALDHFATQGDRADDPVVSDREYVEALGLDPVEAGLDDPTTGDSTAKDGTQTPDLTTDAGDGPDIGVDVAATPQLHVPLAGHADRDRGLSRVTPDSQLSDDGHTYWQVSPRVSELIDAQEGDCDHDLRADLRPQTLRLVQDLVQDRAPEVLDPTDPRHRNVGHVVQEVLADVCNLTPEATDYAVVAEAQDYLHALTYSAVCLTNDDYREDRGFRGDGLVHRNEDILQRAATSDGPFQAPVIETLQKTLVPLYAARDVPEALTFVLNGETWTDADKQTVETALRLFATLGEGFDVRLKYSPGVEEVVERAVERVRARDDDNPDWLEPVSNLTETEMRSHRPAIGDDSESRPTVWDAWDVLSDTANSPDLLQLLPQLRARETRAVTDLKRDSAVQAADGSLYPYLDTLTDMGMVHSETQAGRRHVSLTRLGDVAQRLVADDGRLVHPAQSSFEPGYTGTPQFLASECNAQANTKGGTGGSATTDDEPPTTPEQWLAATGNPRNDGYVQWLGDMTANRPLQPSAMHNRLIAGNRVEGVNLVHEPNHKRWKKTDNGDGRVTYLSGGPEFDDTVLAVAQWGGPAVTLARLIATIFGNAAFGKLLEESRVGTQLETLYDGGHQFKKDLEDILQRGLHLGWTSEDELAHYENWKNRMGDVRSMLLAKLSELEALDAGQKREFLEDLHGLFCTATAVYDAAGFDLVVNLQVPNVTMLQDDETRYQKFLDFIRYTPTKQGVYRDDHGVHSIHRMQREDRPEKLKNRIGYDIDEDDPMADLTCSWIVSGDGAPRMQEDVRAAIDMEQERIRDRIADGDEKAAMLGIPVKSANSFAATKTLVREWAERKSHRPGETTQPLDRLTRMLHAVLGTTEFGASPFDVVSVMQALNSRDGYRDELSVGDLAHGLGQLPANRLLPSLFEAVGEQRKPGLQRMVKALFEADSALSRQDLIDATSENTYQRYHHRLEAIDLVERIDDGQFVASLEPWWSPTNDHTEPRHDAHETEILTTGGQPIWSDVVYGAMLELAYGYAASDVWLAPMELEEVLDEIPELRQFEHLVRTYYDVLETTEFERPSIAMVGRHPAATDDGQQTLGVAQ